VEVESPCTVHIFWHFRFTGHTILSTNNQCVELVTCVCNVMKSNYLLHNVCPFVHQLIYPHETTWHPLDGFSLIYNFLKYDEKIQVWLKSDKNNRHFMWRPLNVYDNFVYKCYHGCLNSNCLISSCKLHGAQLRTTKMCNPNIYYVQEQETCYVDRL
jgi:hypothetical protein